VISLTCAGFLALGIFIGGILIHYRHKYAALVASRLSGKEKEDEEPKWIVDKEVRQVVAVIFLIIVGAIVLTTFIYSVHYVNERWYVDNDYVYIKDPWSNGSGHWEYRGPLKALPAKPAPVATVEDGSAF
jgi:hypothetical protein